MHNHSTKETDPCARTQPDSPQTVSTVLAFVVRNSYLKLREQLELCCIAPCSPRLASSPAQGWPHIMARCIKSIPDKRLCDHFNNIFLPGCNQRKLLCLFVSRWLYLITRGAWQNKLPFRKHCSLM